MRVGDGLTWATNLERRGENGLVGKALDDRLGCLALIELAHRLGAEQPACDLYLAFVVQEETRLEGSAPAIRTIAPDYVIGVDGTLAFDTPDLKGPQSEIRLGHGPALKLFDALRGKGVSYLPDGGLVGRLRRLAERHELPLQSEVVVGISTALSPIPFALQGIATAALSIPIRYHHSGVETADRRDVDRLIQLLLGLARASDS